MRTTATFISLLPLLLLAPRASAAPAITDTADYESAAESIQSKFLAIESLPVYKSFSADAENVMTAFYATQTLVSEVDPGATDAVAPAHLSLELAYLTVMGKYAATQTFVTGAAKETLTGVFAEYISVVKGMAGVDGDAQETGSVTAVSGSAKPTTGATSKASGVAEGSDIDMPAPTSAGTGAEAPAASRSGGAAASGSAPPDSAAASRGVGAILAVVVAGVVAIAAVF
jgi:hypothetical protein